MLRDVIHSQVSWLKMKENEKVWGSPGSTVLWPKRWANPQDFKGWLSHLSCNTTRAVATKEIPFPAHSTATISRHQTSMYIRKLGADLFFSLLACLIHSSIRSLVTVMTFVWDYDWIRPVKYKKVLSISLTRNNYKRFSQYYLVIPRFLWCSESLKTCPVILHSGHIDTQDIFRRVCG